MPPSPAAARMTSPGMASAAAPVSSRPPITARAWLLDSTQNDPTMGTDSGIAHVPAAYDVVDADPPDEPPPPLPEMPVDDVGQLPDEIHFSTVAALPTLVDQPLAAVLPWLHPAHRSKFAAKLPATSAPVDPASAWPLTTDLRNPTCAGMSAAQLPVTSDAELG